MSPGGQNQPWSSTRKSCSDCVIAWCSSEVLGRGEGHAAPDDVSQWDGQGALDRAKGTLPLMMSVGDGRGGVRWQAKALSKPGPVGEPISNEASGGSAGKLPLAPRPCLFYRRPQLLSGTAFCSRSCHSFENSAFGSGR